MRTPEEGHFELAFGALRAEHVDASLRKYRAFLAEKD